MVRKRPCLICQQWFSPHPRTGDRQRTCSAAPRRSAAVVRWQPGAAAIRTTTETIGCDADYRPSLARWRQMQIRWPS